MNIEVALFSRLTVSTAVALIARRLSLPYTVLLVVAGLALGALPREAGPLHLGAVRLTAHWFFDLLLPVLLFEAAFRLSAARLRENVRAILLLAAPGSAVIVEGELLLNDAVGVVAFTLCSALLDVPGAHAPVTAGWVARSFLAEVLGGLAVGAAVGVALSGAMSLVDDRLVELMLTAVAAFGSHLAARALNASLVFATNGLVFLLIGKEVDPGRPLGHAGMIVPWRAARLRRLRRARPSGSPRAGGRGSPRGRTARGSGRTRSRRAPPAAPCGRLVAR